MIIEDSIENEVRITLIPNRSATWKQTRLFLVSLVGLSLVIALFWAAQGVWVILPFAGIEIILLVYLVRAVCSQTFHQQIIYIGKEEITIEWGRKRPTIIDHLKTDSCELHILHPHHSLSPAELTLCSGENKIQIGNFLNKEDTDKLISLLQHRDIVLKNIGQVKIVSRDFFDT